MSKIEEKIQELKQLREIQDFTDRLTLYRTDVDCYMAYMYHTLTNSQIKALTNYDLSLSIIDQMKSFGHNFDVDTMIFGNFASVEKLAKMGFVTNPRWPGLTGWRIAEITRPAKLFKLYMGIHFIQNPKVTIVVDEESVEVPYNEVPLEEGKLEKIQTILDTLDFAH